VKKADVVELLQDLPDEVDPEELIYRLYLKQKLDQAQAAASAGDTVTHEEAIRIAESWRK
jgi:hypothetical protein